MRNFNGRKNISGNLITVYNNAGLDKQEHVKSSGFYYTQKNQQIKEQNDCYIDSREARVKRDRLRSLNDSPNGPYESSDSHEKNRGGSQQHFAKPASMMLKVTGELQTLALPGIQPNNSVD